MEYMDVRNILMSTSSSYSGVGLNWVLHLFKRSYCFCTKEMYLSSVRVWPPTRLTCFFQTYSKSRIQFWISVGRFIFKIYWLCTTHNRPLPFLYVSLLDRKWIFNKHAQLNITGIQQQRTVHWPCPQNHQFAPDNSRSVGSKNHVWLTGGLPTLPFMFMFPHHGYQEDQTFFGIWHC